MKKSIILILSLMLTISLVVGCQNNENGNNTKEISIGSKALTENAIVAEMYAQILEADGFNVDRKFRLGTPVILHDAMQKGDVDMYPEYTGTALMTILKKKPLSDDEEVYQIVKKEYKEQFNFELLEQTPLNNTHAIVVRKEIAEKYGLTTLSELSTIADDIVIGTKPEFLQREDGLKGLQEMYGGFEFKEIKTYEPTLRYKAIENNEIDATVAFSTDGQIEVYDLVLLKDDKKLWPPYHLAPVINAEVLEQYPELETKINEVSRLLTDEVAQSLNWKVDGEKKEVEEVAREFLIENELINE